MSKRRGRAALTAVLAAGLLALAAPLTPVLGASNTVDTSVDQPFDAECVIDCTIRDALGLVGTGDTVSFLNAGIDPALTAGQIVVADDITIDGLGAGVTTIDASGNATPDRVFQFTAAANPATIRDLTITGGEAPDGANGPLFSDPGGIGESGGAVVNNGTLTLNSVTVTGNEAGNGGDGAPGDFGTGNAGGGGGGGGHGGGVMSGGSLTIIDSTISDNHAGDGGAGGGGGIAGAGAGGAGGGGGVGGGVFATGALTVTNSTIGPNNTAGGGGPGGGGGNPGAMIGAGGTGGNGGNGGGIASAGGLTATNSTIADNDAGNGASGGLGPPVGMPTPALGGSGGFGGGIGNQGTFTGSHLTIALNSTGAVGGVGPLIPVRGEGGGIRQFVVGTTTLTNTIVANNSSADPAADANCSGAVINGGGLYSVAFPQEGCVGFVVGDPLLAPSLSNNGGPTLTLSINPGGAAHNQIPNMGAGCAATDQRGVIRPQPAAGLCDVGAFELEQAVTPPPPPPPPGGGPVVIPPLSPATAVPATTRRKKCKKGRKLKKGKCVKKRKK